MTEPNVPTDSGELFEEPPPRTRVAGGEPPSLPLPGDTLRGPTSPLRIAVQILGFLIGLGMLAWCVTVALKPEYRDKLHALSQAPAGLVALLFGLSAASLGLNGAMFYTTILPVRRLRFLDVQSVNAIAALLAYLPFKLSIVSRFVIHNRRDGVPLLTVGAWMAAVAAVLLASMAPVVGAAVWRKEADLIFAFTAGAGLAMAYGLLLLGARLFAHEDGLSRLHRLADPLGVAWLDRLLRSGQFRRIHVALDMLAAPGPLAMSMVLRVADLLVQAARFVVAAQCLGESISLEMAVLAASTFYLVGVLNPSGALGAREGATTGVAALLAVPGLTGMAFTPITLAVSASEVLVNMTGAVLGSAWLRVWTLGVRQRE